MIIYPTRLTPTAYAASSSAAGYGPDNAGLPQLARAWRAATAGAGEHITIDLGSSQVIGAVLLTGVNATGLRVLADDTAAPTTERVASLTSYAEPHGRRKAIASIGGAAARYLRIAFSAASLTAGAAWEVGAIYLFGPASATANALIGSNRVLHRPQVRDELLNGQLAGADTGLPWVELTLQFRAKRDSDPGFIEQAGNAGVIAVDMDIANRRDLVWPMRARMGAATWQFSRALQDDVSITLREVV